MTYVYDCLTCGPKKTFSEEGEVSTDKDVGIKTSCCHKCSNQECKDYGECNCFEEWSQRQKEIFLKMVEDGKIPPNFFKSDDDE
ncbi:MAG: hypothetical protein VX433_02850 [Candidatus Thermoplasmatota archaeon]|jgi:hypothetical protein|nr:hypothetical protein [Candidatus Thermoplasmatota archaeon]|tara:strand:+ start:73 stop:324 length:252 start_codon:yes stop_codon:yes gene_type:complete